MFLKYSVNRQALKCNWDWQWFLLYNKQNNSLGRNGPMCTQHLNMHLLFMGCFPFHLACSKARDLDFWCYFKQHKKNRYLIKIITGWSLFKMMYTFVGLLYSALDLERERSWKPVSCPPNCLELGIVTSHFLPIAWKPDSKHIGSPVGLQKAGMGSIFL